MVTPGTAAVVWCDQCADTVNRIEYSRVFLWSSTLVKTIVALLWYVCGDTWDTGGVVV